MFDCDARGGWKHHVADILPTALESALLALVIDADKQRFAAKGTRTIVVLEALGIIL